MQNAIHSVVSAHKILLYPIKIFFIWTSPKTLSSFGATNVVFDPSGVYKITLFDSKCETMVTRYMLVLRYTIIKKAK